MLDREKNIRTPIRTVSKPSFAERATPSAPSPLEITVLHTDARSTARMLAGVARLAEGLSAEIRLLVLQVVPYPLPLEMPDVPVDFISQQLMPAVLPTNVNVSIDIRVGRDKAAMLESAFPASSMVAIGRRRRWWPTGSNRVARLLERRGRQVISIDLE